MAEPKTPEVIESKQGEKPKESNTEKAVILPRVSKRLDMNTVEVQFDKKGKTGKFKVYSNDVFHGEGHYDGSEETMIVSLTKYLPKGVLHNFSVVM